MIKTLATAAIAGITLSPPALSQVAAGAAAENILTSGQVIGSKVNASGYEFVVRMNNKLYICNLLVIYDSNTPAPAASSFGPRCVFRNF